MTEVRDDVSFQILEHLRALRADVASLRAQVDALERRIAETTPPDLQPRP